MAGFNFLSALGFGGGNLTPPTPTGGATIGSLSSIFQPATPTAGADPWSDLRKVGADAAKPPAMTRLRGMLDDMQQIGNEQQRRNQPQPMAPVRLGNDAAGSLSDMLAQLRKNRFQQTY